MKANHNLLLIALLAAFVSLAIGYSIAIPAGEGVDEIPHFDYIRYVKEHRRLPVQPTAADGEVAVWMGHHPPLYYVLSALSISLTDTSDFGDVFRPNPHFTWRENVGRNGWNVMMHFGQDEFPWEGSLLALHIARFVTIGWGAMAVFAIYHAARLLFPEHPWAPLGATGVVCLNPSFIFMSSTVHHDALQVAIFSLTAWWALRFLRRSPRWYDAWLGGGLVGAACLTKLSGLTLAPFVGLTFLLESWDDHCWRRLLARAAAAGTAAVVVCGWWFARNQWYYGDPLGWEMFLTIHRHMVRNASYGWREFADFIRQLGRTFWGGFGYMHITFPRTAKYLWSLTGIAGCGLLVQLLRGRASVKEKRPGWILAIALLLLLTVSFVRFSIATVGAGHGRYLLPAGVSIGALLIAGLNGFTDWQHQRAASILATVAMMAYAIWLPVTHVLPKYSGPQVATVDELAQAEPVDVVLGDTLRLCGYRVNTDLARPGEWLHVKLYWQAVGPPEDRADPQVQLQVTTEGGGAIASRTVWPTASLSPAVWQADAIYVTSVALQMPAEGVTGRASLKIGALSNRTGNYLPARDKDGRPADHGLVKVGDLLTVGAVTEVDPATAPQDHQGVFGSEIALVSFEFPNRKVSPGSTVPIVFSWEVLEDPSADYTVFIHVLNDQGELVTQFDSPPGGGLKPTSTWEAGQFLRDSYPLPIPSDTRAGTYELRAGMYTWPSLERLDFSVNGTPVGDSVALGTIEVDS